MTVYYREEKSLHKKDENDDLRAQITQDVMKMIQKELKKIKPELIAAIKAEVLQEISQEGARDATVQNAGWDIVDGTGHPDAANKPSYLWEIDGFHYDGWIYYTNRENGKFLYKIRENGKDNRRLTDYTVDVYDTDFYVRNGDVYIDTCEHKIKIKL